MNPPVSRRPSAPAGGQVPVGQGIALTALAIIPEQSPLANPHARDIELIQGKTRIGGGRLGGWGWGCGLLGVRTGQTLLDILPVGATIRRARQIELQAIQRNGAEFQPPRQQGPQAHAGSGMAYRQHGRIPEARRIAQRHTVEFQPQPGKDAQAELAIQRQRAPGALADDADQIIAVGIGIEYSRQDECQHGAQDEHTQHAKTHRLDPSVHTVSSSYPGDSPSRPARAFKTTGRPGCSGSTALMEKPGEG